MRSVPPELLEPRMPVAAAARTQARQELAEAQGRAAALWSFWQSQFPDRERSSAKEPPERPEIQEHRATALPETPVTTQAVMPEHTTRVVTPRDTTLADTTRPVTFTMPPITKHRIARHQCRRASPATIPDTIIRAINTRTPATRTPATRSIIRTREIRSTILRMRAVRQTRAMPETRAIKGVWSC